MEQAKLLIVAMAEQCGAVIKKSQGVNLGLSPALQPKHLLWMCNAIARHAEDWPAIKLHRWIGFVQSGVLANRLLDLDGAKAMFSEAKRAYGELQEDRDLVDHLNPQSSFKMDLGGQG